MKAISLRKLYFIGFLVIVFMLGMVCYLQTYKGFTPCPLCLLQRYVLMVLGALFFLGIFFRQKLIQYLIGFCACFFTTAGILLAGRQVWLQYLPANQGSDCGASLQYLLQVFPLQEVIQKVLTGSAECSQVGWEFFNMSLAVWSLIFFILLFLLSLWQCFRISNK
jgi:disulfide bond formation protein DsbB